MAWPLIALAAAGALKGVGENRKKAAERENAYRLAEDARKRRQSEFTLTAMPQLHGAEQRKTMGNLFARGMWGNFGRDPTTGSARSAELAAILNDPWVYRNQQQLAALSPHLAPVPKLKGGGFWGALGDIAGGAGQGAAMYYGAGGSYGLGGGGGGGDDWLHGGEGLL